MMGMDKKTGGTFLNVSKRHLAELQGDLDNVQNSFTERLIKDEIKRIERHIDLLESLGEYKRKRNRKSYK